MRDKAGRLEAIKTVMSVQDISSQKELLRELKKAGFKLTQATLSRDLKLLKAVRTTNASGKHAYLLPSRLPYRRVPDTHADVPASRRSGVLSVKFSGNLSVVHTLPGHASRVAYDIDNKGFEEILGTLAGDDTVILVLAEGISPELVLRRLSEAIPDMLI